MPAGGPAPSRPKRKHEPARACGKHMAEIICVSLQHLYMPKKTKEQTKKKRKGRKQQQTTKPWSRFQKESSAPAFTHPVVHIVGHHAMWTPEEGWSKRYPLKLVRPGLPLARSLGDSPTGGENRTTRRRETTKRGWVGSKEDTKRHKNWRKLKMKALNRHSEDQCEQRKWLMKCQEVV